MVCKSAVLFQLLENTIGGKEAMRAALQQIFRSEKQISSPSLVVAEDGSRVVGSDQLTRNNISNGVNVLSQSETGSDVVPTNSSLRPQQPVPAGGGTWVAPTPCEFLLSAR